MTASPQQQHVEDDRPTPTTQIKLDIFPHSFKNEQFEQNLAYFKIAQPAIYNAVFKHCCKEYRLCSNPDGSPNIIETKSNAPVYNTFDRKSFWDFINKSIKNISVNASILQTFLGAGDAHWKSNNPIQHGMLNSLYENGLFHQLEVRDDNLEPLKSYSTDFLPLIRIYGIGLGYHITELIRLKTICYMSIYEPKLDLFYTSLYTIPWKLVFQYFDIRGKGLNLVLGDTPDNAIRKNVAFSKQRFMPLTTCFYRFKHLGSVEANELIKKEPQSDAIELQQSDAGWYEDQRTGVYHSARNIKNHNKFFSGKQVSTPFRAFVIGSGPSLNDSIEYLKKHQNNAIIFSCGTAITPLLKAGIIPDYEVVQERFWHFPKYEEKHDPGLLKKISLLKLNVVSPKIDKYYKETLVFQKFRDPGSSLLGKNYAVTTAVNPTVTNAGISICAALGANEVYLFGVDYGAPGDSKKMHAANTIYDNNQVDDSVESKTNFDLPGNLGAKIRTTTVLSWSLQTSEQKIAEYPQIKWYNVGEGALIKGAIPTDIAALPNKLRKNGSKQTIKKLRKKGLKQTIKQQITSCFDNHYSPEKILQKLKTEQMEQINQYLDTLLGFNEASPQTREEIVNVLRLIYEAVNTGSDQSGYLPSALLPYGFKQFITNVYIQCSLAKDDISAARFFEKSKDILFEYIADIKRDLINIMAYIELEEETEFIKSW